MDLCSICIDNLENNASIVKLDCGHLFHYDCIINVKNNKCPNCRSVIVNEPICENNHINNFFYVSNIKKNGKCFICLKKSFKYCLKEKYINNENQNNNGLKKKRKRSIFNFKNIL